MYPYYSQPSPQGNPYQTGLQNVKGFFRKPLILIVAIVYSLFTLSTVITNLIQVMDYSRMYGSRYNAVSGYIATIMSVVIMGLMCLAVWLIYLKSRSKKPTASPSAGLTILYVYAIIALVIVCLLVAICLIAVIGLMAAGGSLLSSLGNSPYFEGFFEEYGMAYSVAMPVVILVVAIVMTILILFVVSMLRFVGSARRSLHSSAMYKGGSIACGVFFSLAALGTISTLIDYITQMYYSPLIKILLIINSMLSLTFMVLMAVVSFAYHSYCSKTNYAAIASAPRAEAYNGGYPPAQPNPYGGYSAPNGGQYTPYGQPQQNRPEQQNGQAPYYGNPYGSQPNPYAPPAQQPASPQNASGYAAPYQEPAAQPINDSLPVEPSPEQNVPQETSGDLYSDSSAEQSFYSPESAFVPPVQPDPEEEKNIWEPSPAPVENTPAPEAPIVSAPAEAPAAADEVKCPTCGASLPKGSHFCFRCGGRIE